MSVPVCVCVDSTRWWIALWIQKPPELPQARGIPLHAVCTHQHTGDSVTNLIV